MRFGALLILTFLSTISYGQEFSYPVIKGKITGQRLSDFIPKGWFILDSTTGDLNNDGISDATLILEHIDSVIISNDDVDSMPAQPRILLILLKNGASGKFVVSEQTNSFILMHFDGNMEEPYQEMKISKGVLELRFQLFASAGTWYITNSDYKFKYRQGEFVLIGADRSSTHRGTGEYEAYSYNFLTGKRSLKKGNNSKETEKISWKTIKITPLKTVKTFKAPFTWEVEEDVYL